MVVNDSCAGLDCTGTLFAYSKPTGGWKGTITGSSAPVAAPDDQLPFVMDGSTIATGGVDAINLFSVQAGAPSEQHTSVTGIEQGTPKLAFTINTDPNAKLLQSITVTLPSGLRFARQRRGRTAGIRVSVPSGVTHRADGAITLRLRSAAHSVTVTIGSAALVETNSLLAKAKRIHRYNLTHYKRTATITTHIAITDTSHRTTHLTLTSNFV
jgi:hypothetical protein